MLENKILIQLVCILGPLLAHKPNAFKLRFAGGQTVVHFYMLTGQFDPPTLIFKGIRPETHIELLHEISNNVVYATSKASDQPAQTRRLIRAFTSRLDIL